MKEFSYKDIKIRWFGHDSFVVLGKKKNVYFDPYELRNEVHPKADIVITSHEHLDHCNPDSINMISDSETVLIGPQSCQDLLQNKIKTKKVVQKLNPYDKIALEDISISAIPAYNTHRFRSPGTPFHSKEANHIGPILEIDGIKIYHAGDADNIPEMKELDVDIAFLPVSGTYVMDVEECAEVAKFLKTKVIIPMHIGQGIGKLEYARELEEKLPDHQVIVLDIFEN